MTTTHPTSETIDGSASEFSDWLAREMPPGTVISDPRWWAPRIAARFATTQPPKPAGAVPLPETLPTPAFREDQPERFGRVRGWNECLAAFMAYIDAREAAGRAGVVPDSWREFADWCGSNAVVAKGRVYFDDGQEFRRRLHAIRSALKHPAADAAAPAAVNQPLTTEGAGGDAVANSALFDAILAAVEESCPRWGEAHDNRALHKLYPREREWIASRVFAAVAHLAPTPAADAGGVAYARLADIWRALDSTLGDTDPYFSEDMTDEDIRDESPVWWAARELRAVIDGADAGAALTPEVRHGEPR